MIAIGVSSVALGQAKMSTDKNNSVETQIIVMEKAGWEAWKNKDASWFRTNQADDALSVHADGVTDKAQGIKDLRLQIREVLENRLAREIVLEPRR